MKEGDKVLIKQKSTTTKPPWDLKPYKVTKIIKSTITAGRDGDKVTRNTKHWKLTKARPKELQTEPQRREASPVGRKENTTHRGYETRSMRKATPYDFHKYDFDLKKRKVAQRYQGYRRR